MRKRHIVRLTDDQRAALDDRDRGPLTRRERNRVQVLLRADAGGTDAEIAGDLGVSVGTVANVRRRFAAGGLGAAVTEKPRPGAAPLLDGKAEAVVIALPVAPPRADGPGGRPGCWRTGWSSWRWSSRCPRTPSSGSSKKRPQAVAEEELVPAEGGSRGVRPPDGGRAGTVRRAARPRPTGGLLRRVQQGTPGAGGR